MAKKKIENQDFLTFSGVGAARADIKAEDRNLAGELYKKNWQERTLDQFEKVQGIQPSTKAKANLKYKSKLFAPEFDKDAGLLNELMNHPKFSIIYWKDNWTPDGNYKVFAIYAENLDWKDPEEIIKDIAQA